MLRYGKTSQNAISAISCLAEIYDGGATRINSQDIATKRKLPKPLVAKLLVVLSQAGLVEGVPGPRGGYWLAKDPKEISLAEIVRQFEKSTRGLACPFGPDWCGNGDPCPLHDQLERLDRELGDYLEHTTLAVFQK